MPIYEFKCSTCKQIYTSSQRILETPTCRMRTNLTDTYGSCTLVCGGILKRVFNFNLKHSMPEHFNHSVGKHVTNESKLRDEFKRLSDAATERTGIPHNYVPVDPMDKETLGVTDEGLDATHDAMVKRGEKEETSKRRVVHLG